MKVAIFSDVQGNLTAFKTVADDILRWDPDLVVLNGDLINRGPDSLGCLRLFNYYRKNSDWIPLQGNHEEYVKYCSAHPADTAIDAELRRFADWTVDQLGDEIDTLSNWADHLTFSDARELGWVHVTHGTLIGNRDGVSVDRPDGYLLNRTPDDLALFVTAHTHKPMHKSFGSLPVLNVGSVGSPFDGDPRASYAQLEYKAGLWRANIVRLEYDRIQAEREFHTSGFLEQCGPLARLIFEEWRQARMMIAEWNKVYRLAVEDGTISLASAVDAFLGTRIRP